MPPTCTVCRLPNRQELEEALLAGTPLRNIAERFGTSATALHRHKESHLLAKLVKAKDAQEVADAGSLLSRLEKLASEAVRLAKKAEDEGDLRTAAAVGVRELVRVIELIARLRGELQASTANVRVNIQNQRMKLLGVKSEEELNESLAHLLALAYRRNPSSFVNTIRVRAAKEHAEIRRISVEAALGELLTAERGDPNPGWEDTLPGREDHREIAEAEACRACKADDTLSTSRLVLPPEPREIVAATPPAPKQLSAGPAVIQTAPGPSLPKAVAGSIADSRLGRGAATIGRKPA